MPEPIDLRGIRALDAVTRVGSVAAAASALGWSGPTVDHHVRNLERAVGATLLERGPRGSAVTDAGAIVAARGAELLALSDRLRDEVSQWQRDGAIPVRVGAFPTMGARILPPVHARLAREENAPIEVALDEVGRLVAALNRGDLDVAVLSSMTSHELGLDPEITTSLLFSEAVALCVGERHPLSDAPSFAELRDERWAFGTDDEDALDAATRAACRAAGFEPSTGMRSDDFHAVLRMVATGLVVAVVPRSALEHVPQGVRIVPLPREQLRRDVMLAVRPTAGLDAAPSVAALARRRASALARVVACVRAVAADIAAEDEWPVGAHD